MFTPENHGRFGPIFFLRSACFSPSKKKFGYEKMFLFSIKMYLWKLMSSRKLFKAAIKQVPALFLPVYHRFHPKLFCSNSGTSLHVLQLEISPSIGCKKQFSSVSPPYIKNTRTKEAQVTHIGLDHWMALCIRKTAYNFFFNCWLKNFF